MLAGVILGGFLGRASAAEAIKNSACLDCHSDKTLYRTNAAGKGISLFVDQAKLTASVHKTNACVSCHSDLTSKHPDDNVAAKPVNCAQCHEKQSESYGASVHGLALARGETGAANCSDCHDGHTIVPPTSPDSPLHFRAWLKRAALATNRQPRMSRRACMAKPLPRAIAMPPPARIATRSTK